MNPQDFRLFESTVTTENLIEARAAQLDRLSWYRTLGYIRKGYNKECKQPSRLKRWALRAVDLLLPIL